MGRAKPPAQSSGGPRTKLAEHIKENSSQPIERFSVKQEEKPRPTPKQKQKLKSKARMAAAKVNAIAKQMDPPSSRRRPCRSQAISPEPEISSSSPIDVDSSNDATSLGGGGNGSSNGGGGGGGGGGAGANLECRRSSRKKTIKFDVRDLLNKNRKSHKIQIEARIDSNAPKQGAGQPSKEELHNKQKTFNEKSAIFRRYSISENKLPPRPPPPPVALIQTIQQCVGELEQLPLDGDIDLAAISPLTRRLSRTQEILTASMMKPKQVNSLIVTKLESASITKTTSATRSTRGAKTSKTAETSKSPELRTMTTTVTVSTPATTTTTGQKRRGRPPKLKTVSESPSTTTESSSDSFETSTPTTISKTTAISTPTRFHKRSSTQQQQQPSTSSRSLQSDQGKITEDFISNGRNNSLSPTSSTKGIDLKELLDASAVTLPQPTIVDGCMLVPTDELFVAAEEEVCTELLSSDDSSVFLCRSPKEKHADEISLFARSNSTETSGSDDSENRRRKIRVAVKRVVLPSKIKERFDSTSTSKYRSPDEKSDIIEILSSNDDDDSSDYKDMEVKIDDLVNDSMEGEGEVKFKGLLTSARKRGKQSHVSSVLTVDCDNSNSTTFSCIEIISSDTATPVEEILCAKGNTTPLRMTPTRSAKGCKSDEQNTPNAPPNADSDISIVEIKPSESPQVNPKAEKLPGAPDVAYVPALSTEKAIISQEGTQEDSRVDDIEPDTSEEINSAPVTLRNRRSSNKMGNLSPKTNAKSLRARKDVQKPANPEFESNIQQEEIPLPKKGEEMGTTYISLRSRKDCSEITSLEKGESSGCKNDKEMSTTSDASDSSVSEKQKEPETSSHSEGNSTTCSKFLENKSGVTPLPIEIPTVSSPQSDATIHISLRSRRTIQREKETQGVLPEKTTPSARGRKQPIRQQVSSQTSTSEEERNPINEKPNAEEKTMDEIKLPSPQAKTTSVSNEQKKTQPSTIIVQPTAEVDSGLSQPTEDLHKKRLQAKPEPELLPQPAEEYVSIETKIGVPNQSRSNTSNSDERKTLHASPSKRKTPKTPVKVKSTKDQASSSSESSEEHTPKSRRHTRSRALTKFKEENSSSETSSVISSSSSSTSSSTTSTSSTSSSFSSSSSSSKSSSSTSPTHSSPTSSSSTTSSNSQGRTTRSRKQQEPIPEEPINIKKEKPVNLRLTPPRRAKSCGPKEREQKPTEPDRKSFENTSKQVPESPKPGETCDVLFKERGKLLQRRRSTRLNRWDIAAEDETNETGSESSETSSNQRPTRSGRSRGRSNKSDDIKDTFSVNKRSSSLVMEKKTTEELEPSDSTQTETSTDKSITEKVISHRTKPRRRTRKFIPLKDSESESNISTFSDTETSSNGTGFETRSLRSRRVRRKTLSDLQEMEELRSAVAVRGTVNKFSPKKVDELQKVSSTKPSKDKSNLESKLEFLLAKEESDRLPKPSDQPPIDLKQDKEIAADEQRIKNPQSEDIEDKKEQRSDPKKKELSSTPDFMTTDEVPLSEQSKEGDTQVLTDQVDSIEPNIIAIEEPKRVSRQRKGKTESPKAPKPDKKSSINKLAGKAARITTQPNQLSAEKTPSQTEVEKAVEPTVENKMIPQVGEPSTIASATEAISKEETKHSVSSTLIFVPEKATEDIQNSAETQETAKISSTIEVKATIEIAGKTSEKIVALDPSSIPPTEVAQASMEALAETLSEVKPSSESIGTPNTRESDAKALKSLMQSEKPLAKPESPAVEPEKSLSISKKELSEQKLETQAKSNENIEKSEQKKEQTPRRKKKLTAQPPELSKSTEDSQKMKKNKNTLELNKDFDSKPTSAESTQSDDSLKVDTPKVESKPIPRRQLDSSFIESLEKSLLKPISAKKLLKKKEKETVITPSITSTPQTPALPTTVAVQEPSPKSKETAKKLKKITEELKKAVNSSPKAKKKQKEVLKIDKDKEDTPKRKALIKAKDSDPKPIEPQSPKTEVQSSVSILNDKPQMETALAPILEPVKDSSDTAPKALKSKGETKFYPEEPMHQEKAPLVLPSIELESTPVEAKEKSPDLLPDPLKDIEKFIEDGVNLLKRGYKLEDDETALDRDILKADELITPKKCKFDETSSVDASKQESSPEDDNSNSNSECSTLVTTGSSEGDTPNGIRRSHRIKNNSKSSKCLVGRGLVRDRERFSLKDDEKTFYSIDDQKMDLAEVEAKNSKFLKDMEERLSNFRVIRENEYKCERVISKEARRMLCDCFLTHEEEERGELGCGEDCLNRLLMIECGSDCTVRDRCTNRRFTKFLYSPCRVFRTEKKGFGIMADIEILPGEFIMEYVGEVINSDEFERRGNAYSQEKNKHYYFMALRSDAIIDATAKGNISRFINHSCDPNAETQKWTVNGELRIGFFSRKNIMPGEEITFDYQYQRYGKEAQKCYCESANCRGWIGEEPSSEDEEEELDEEEEESEETEGDEEQPITPLVDIQPSIPLQVTVTAQLMPAVAEVSEVSPIVKDIIPAIGVTAGEPQPDPTPTLSAIAEKPLKNLQIKKKKEKKRFAERKEDKLKRRETKQFLEDPDIEDEVRFLVNCGLKNQADTLRLSRLIVRAKLLETRLKLLQILRKGELPCRRLFLDYHGLRLLHGWMSEAIDTRDTEKSMEIRMALLSVLESLPIPNKTMLTDSKVYQTVRDWSHNKESHSPSDGSPKEGIIMSVSSSPVEADDTASELQKLAAKLFKTWDNLPEVFRIPKRERIEQMKEHEREADLQFKGLADDVSRSGENRNRERFMRNNGPNGGRFKWSKDKDRERPGDRRRFTQNGSSGKDGGEKSVGTQPVDLQLSKEQRRELFAAKVARDEADKRLAEERREFDIKCRFFGLDPKRMRPENMPFCVNPSTGQWYSTDKKPIATPPSYAHVQVPVKPKSTNPSDYKLPPMDLPPLWKYAISPKGKIYYYHVKIRIPQWEPPIKILPLAGQNSNSPVKNSESDSSNGGVLDSSEDDIEVIKGKLGKCVFNKGSLNQLAVVGLDPVKLQAYIEKKIENRRLQRYNRLVDEKSISPRKEEDRIYNQMEVRKYKENKEKIRKRKEEIRRRRDVLEKSLSTDPTLSQSKSQSSDNSDNPSDAVPIQDYLLSSEEDDVIKAECNNSPLYDKIVQGDKIVDELDALQCKKTLKRPLPIREKYEHKKRKLEKIKDSSKSTKRSKDGEGSSSSSSKHRREKFRCEIAGIIVQHLKSYRKETCFSGRILTDTDFNHLARKLTHFVMVKEMKYCESVGQTLVVTESVKNKSREFIKKYMAKYGGVYVRPKNDPEYKEIPFL